MEETQIPEVSVPPQEKTFKQSFWELVRFALVALVIVLPIRFFIAEPFVVSGLSMYPTFDNGNYLIVDKLSYKLSDPQRDDVVVFIYPDPVVTNPKKYFIKRIIGLPGETVDVKDNVVTITNTEHPDGFPLNEPFIKDQGGINAHLQLKSDEYFVMGDNRGGSSDSRYWGPVKRSLLTGRAFLRLLPVNKLSVLPGNYKQ